MVFARAHRVLIFNTRCALVHVHECIIEMPFTCLHYHPAVMASFLDPTCDSLCTGHLFDWWVNQCMCIMVLPPQAVEGEKCCYMCALHLSPVLEGYVDHIHTFDNHLGVYTVGALC